MEKKWLVVGMCGVTCGGKTSIVKQLKEDFPGIVVIAQDDYFFPPEAPSHVVIPELNHVNYELMSSLDMERMRKDIQKALDLQPTHKQWPVLIIEGFAIYRDSWITELCDLRFFLTLDREECYRRRIVRVYEPPDPPGYFELAVWPEYLKIAQEAFSLPGIIELDGQRSQKETRAVVVQHIQEQLKSRSK